jgi:hypothetical protein
MLLFWIGSGLKRLRARSFFVDNQPGVLLTILKRPNLQRAGIRYF